MHSGGSEGDWDSVAQYWVYKEKHIEKNLVGVLIIVTFGHFVKRAYNKDWVS